MFLSRLRAVSVVVGGNGALGRHMQKVLAAKGETVRVLDMSGSPSVVLGETPLEELTTHLAGADVVYSMVMPNLLTAPRPKFEQTNVHGIQQLIEACKAAAVPRLVHVSSVAVTNHLANSVNHDETHPMPPLESYASPYDLTKRKGEDAVLASNSDKLRTCVLRPGAVFMNPKDAFFAYILSTPGTINSAKGEKMNYIGASDFCRALTLAAEKLDSPDVAGQAFFVTKSRDGESPYPGDVATYIGKKLGWKCNVLPNAIIKGVAFQKKINDTIDRWKGKPEVGIPMHLYVQYILYEKTFDNSRAHELLGFTPEFTWREAVDEILEEFNSEQKA